MLIAHEYVIRHNAGVNSGRWEPLGELFHEDATLTFEGVPHPPVRGRAAIVQAFASRPPTDLLLPRALNGIPGGAVVRYAWASAPDRHAGSLRFGHEGGAIRSLLVSDHQVGFAVLYRFTVHPGREVELVEVWRALTEHIAVHRGSFGSRLHRAGAQVYLAYAQWPSRAVWAAPPGPAAPELGARMKDCCASIEVAGELELESDLLL